MLKHSISRLVRVIWTRSCCPLYDFSTLELEQLYIKDSNSVLQRWQARTSAIRSFLSPLERDLETKRAVVKGDKDRRRIKEISRGKLFDNY